MRSVGPFSRLGAALLGAFLAVGAWTHVGYPALMLLASRSRRPSDAGKPEASPTMRPRAASTGLVPVPVVVLGSGLTALGVQRSLAAAGIETFLVDNMKRDMARLSRWARRRIIEHPESADPANLQALLDGLPVEEAVLMACSDNWGAAVSGLAETTRKKFVTSMPSPEVYELLADKATLAETLRRLGVAHPWTRAVSDASDLDEVPEEMWSSIFLKPTDSQSFSQLFDVKAFSVTDRADAARRLEQMKGAGIGAVVQEYIPGPSDLHYFIDGFIDRTGTIRALFSRRRTRMFPPDYGNSTFMESVPLETVSGAVADLEVLLEDLSYQGIFSAEFKHDPRDGVFRLLEVNVRPWWFIEFATLCGINVCELAYLDALDLPVPERRSFPVGARHRLMPKDFHAYRHHRRTGELTFRTWLDEIRGATDAVYRRNDPLPAIDPVLKAPRKAVNELKNRLARRRVNH